MSMKSPYLQELVLHHAAARADIRRGSSRNPCAAADVAAARSDRELDAAAEVELAQPGRLRDGQPQVVDEIAVFGVLGCTRVVEAANRAQSRRHGDFDIDPDRRSVEILAVDREMFLHERKEVAVRAREDPAAANPDHPFRAAEEEIGRGLGTGRCRAKTDQSDRHGQGQAGIAHQVNLLVDAGHCSARTAPSENRRIIGFSRIAPYSAEDGRPVWEKNLSHRLRGDLRTSAPDLFHPGRHTSLREPARRRGRGSALRLAERWSAKAKRYENAPVGAFSGEGSASHFARRGARSTGETRFLPRASSTTRETHLPAKCRRRSRSPFRRCRHADLTPPDAFPAAPRVASLAMARFRKPVSPVDRARVQSLSAHGNATCGVSRGRLRGGHLPARVSPTVEEPVAWWSPRGIPRLRTAC